MKYSEERHVTYKFTLRDLRVSPIMSTEFYRYHGLLGDGDHLNTLGCLYYLGDGIPRNTDRAFDCFWKASELGRREAFYNIGVMFYSGNRFPKDFRIAFDWFKKGADAGDRDSLYALGLMTLWGQGVKKNTKEAFDIFHKLIEVDYPLAIKIFYNHLDSPSAKEIAERFEHLEKEALAGDDDAQCELGGMYLIGEGAPKAELMAYEWLGLAAFKGHSKAQHDLAVMCRDGLGIGFDYKKSVFWFKKLAENGSDVDQDALGWLYLDLGESKKALKWCKKAAKHGNLDAMYHVALIYLLDEGIPRDAEKAAIELEKAASKGHLRSQVALTELREKAIIK